MIGIPEKYANEKECAKFWNQLTDGKVDYVYITKDVDRKYFEVDEANPDPEFSDLATSKNNYMSLAKMVAQRDATKVALDAAKHDNKPEEEQNALQEDLTQLEKDIALMR